MGDVEIHSWEGFRGVLAQLNLLVQQIPAKRDLGSKVSAAASAAADNEGATAPAYTGSITALGNCIEGVGTHVDAAAAAVQGVLGELEMTVNGMQDIDSGAADAVTNV